MVLFSMVALLNAWDDEVVVLFVPPCVMVDLAGQVAHTSHTSHTTQEMVAHNAGRPVTSYLMSPQWSTNVFTSPNDRLAYVLSLFRQEYQASGRWSSGGRPRQ